MRSLVLGGSGFIGSHLVERLLEGGHEARVYDRGSNPFRETSPEVEYVEGEFGDRALVREAVEGVDTVFHFISTTLPKTSNDDPVYDVRTNLVDTVRLLECCVEAGARKVVFSSSGGTVYGPPRSAPITEEHPTDPITSYGIVKLAIEKYLNLFHLQHGLDYAALRISNPYGPGQNPSGQQGAVTVFLNRIRTGEPITVWGDGSVVRDYLYISDLARALALAAEAQTESKVFNIGSGRGVSVNELLEVMAAVVGESLDVEYLPARSLDVPLSVLDVSRAREELGWSAGTDLAEGVARTWEWLSALPEAVVRREG